jgi:membrane protein DedA with SNARE-associated domain
MQLESWPMSRVSLGVLLGLAIGSADVLLMLPLSFPDKRAALLGAFCARFALGFFASTVRIPLPPIATGMLVGVLTSLPDAIITNAAVPIMVTGVVFGAIAGWIVGRWARAQSN